MPAALRCFRRRAMLFAGLLALVLSLLPASPLAASGTSQGAGEPVDIAEKECAFWLDFDQDGEGDAAIDTGPGHYARQETAVVGGCTFKLNTRAEATLVVVSELDDWSSEVEISQEPSLPERFTLHPGRAEIPGLEGGMKISVNHTGQTPRSVKSRSLPDDYEHEVQVPRPFRLLEVTVITPAGKKDRLEENVQSASSAYISAHERINDRTSGAEAAPPDSAMALAGELLDEGYPQIADRVLGLEMVSVGNGGTNWWKWGTLIGLGVLVVIAVVGGATVWLTNRDSDPEQRRTSRLPDM